jgi:hypothetical protein
VIRPRLVWHLIPEKRSRQNASFLVKSLKEEYKENCVNLLSLLPQTVTEKDHELRVYHSPIPAPKGPFFRSLFHSQEYKLDEGLVIRKDRFVLRHLLDLPIQTFDRIRRINQSRMYKRRLQGYRALGYETE